MDESLKIVAGNYGSPSGYFHGEGCGFGVGYGYGNGYGDGYGDGNCYGISKSIVDSYSDRLIDETSVFLFADGKFKE